MTYVYDIEHIPVDTWNGEDGDNSLVKDGVSLGDVEHDFDAIFENERILLSGAPSATIYVPFKRTIRRGYVGPDCYAVKRALSAAGNGPWGGWGSVPRLFGPYAVINLKNFQKERALVVDGVYGLATHRKLAPFFDQYGRWLMGQTKVLSTEDLKRQKIVATAMHGYANRYGMHYTQGWMRMQGVKQRIKPPAYPRYEDCSSFATWCYWVAGVADPNGLGYNGYGFTGTLATHGRAISYPYAKPGDLVFYGRFPYNHVTVYVGKGMCVSHGSEAGPLFLPYNYRTVNHIRSYL
jgi:cell wall-associated NlpC family hydrolase